MAGMRYVVLNVLPSKSSYSRGADTGKVTVLGMRDFGRDKSNVDSREVEEIPVAGSDWLDRTKGLPILEKERLKDMNNRESSASKT